MMAAAAADSRLVHITALYNIKKEPGQEPSPANSRDEHENFIKNIPNKMATFDWVSGLCKC